MGSASIALGAPDCCSGIMDGSNTGAHHFGEEQSQGGSFGVNRSGKILQPVETVAVESAPEHTQEPEKEVTLRQLWYLLPPDKRTQFGSCFSRMLLNCLIETDYGEQEVNE